MKNKYVLVCGLFAVALIATLWFTACEQPANSPTSTLTGITELLQVQLSQKKEK
jgi:hypothetical protein